MGTFISPSQTLGRFTDIAISPDRTRLSLPSAAKQVVFVGGFLPPHDFLQWGKFGTKGYQDGDVGQTRFNDPWFAVFKPDGSYCYVSDRLNHCIRLIDFNMGRVTTFAGTNAAGFENGQGQEARFNSPNGMDIDADGSLYVADRNNHSIRKIVPENFNAHRGEVTTIAGNGTPGLRDGPARQALFNKPRGLALDKEGNIYVADFENNSIRKISTDSMVSTIINGLSNGGFVDGVGVPDHPSGEPETKINGPNDLYVNEDGTIFFTDQRNHAVRKVTFE